MYVVDEHGNHIDVYVQKSMLRIRMVNFFWRGLCCKRYIWKLCIRFPLEWTFRSWLRFLSTVQMSHYQADFIGKLCSCPGSALRRVPRLV